MAQKWFIYRRTLGKMFERKAKFVISQVLHVSRRIMKSATTF